MKKLLPISLGCAKNQIDLEYLLAKMTKSQFVLTDNFEDCDYILVNTCSFIQDAREESEAVIRKYESEGKLIIAGCYPQLEKIDVKKNHPSVKWFIGTEPHREASSLMKALHKNEFFFNLNPNDGEYLECSNRIAFGAFHTFVKLSEGCSRKCAYCSIPRIRGALRSREMTAVKKEIESLSKAGFKEFNLVSEDSSMYGREKNSSQSISNLIRFLRDNFKESIFRLLYVFPDKNIYEIIDLIAASDNFIKYIDIPFQHSSERVLKRMSRNQENALDVALYVKSKGLLLRSSVMVGFPGESEKDFNDLLEFIGCGLIDKLGIFMYSDEKNTKSFSLKGKVSERVKIERFNAIVKKQRIIAAGKMRNNIGKMKPAVFSRSENGLFIGRLIEDAPAVDSILISHAKKPLNKEINVKIKCVKNYTYFA
ncbi:MAG: MiaB/RimO family radical SAM methylthiotransferase [bacterium]|nr:MiaB/RimO family radical SAM methylthiotransferase [bacterium]